MTRITVINPNTTESMTAGIAQSARAVAGPGVSIRAVTSAMGPVSIESHYDEALAVPGVLQVVAGDPDADAFVVACFGDPGIEAAREVAAVPVIGIAEAAMKAATLVGNRFSVVTTLGRTIGRAWHLVDQHGLHRQCADIHACEIPVLDLDDNREATFTSVYAASRAALRADHSDAIVLGCAGMAWLPDRLSDALGVPVFDGVASAVVFAEGLVRMHARPASHGELAPPPPKRYTGALEGFSLLPTVNGHPAISDISTTRPS